MKKIYKVFLKLFPILKNITKTYVGRSEKGVISIHGFRFIVLRNNFFLNPISSLLSALRAGISVAF